MNNMTSGNFSDIYESPIVTEYSVNIEGVLCASGTHDSLVEEDDWADLLN